MVIVELLKKNEIGLILLGGHVAYKFEQAYDNGDLVH